MGVDAWGWVSSVWLVSLDFGDASIVWGAGVGGVLVARLLGVGGMGGLLMSAVGVEVGGRIWGVEDDGEAERMAGLLLV